MTSYYPTIQPRKEKVCYPTIQPRKEKVCSIDPSHKTKFWGKDPFDKTRDLCNTCYQKAHTEKQTQEGRACHIDPSHKTIIWYKDPFDKTRDLCNTCYKKAHTEMVTQKGRVCSVDPSHMTKEWRKDPFDNTRDLCKTCYQKAHTEMVTQKGRVCNIDPSHNAHLWYRDPVDKTRYLCQSCYRRATKMTTQKGEACSIDPSHQTKKRKKDSIDIRDLSQICNNSTITQEGKSSESNSEENFTKIFKQTPSEHTEPCMLGDPFVEHPQFSPSEKAEEIDSYFFDYPYDSSITHPPLPGIADPFAASMSKDSGYFENDGDVFRSPFDPNFNYGLSCNNS
jgi:hypothetical protein